VALVHIPLSAFYVDDQTGVIWAPDPNGSRVSPDGLYKLAPQTPASSSTDPTTGQTSTTYAPISDATAQAAAVPISPAVTAAGSSSTSSDGYGYTIFHSLLFWFGAAAVAALVLTTPKRR
jgi:hypothetical protein